MNNSKKLFCFGLGFSAQVFAGDLLALGWQVAGTCRDEGTQKALQAKGIEAHLFDRGRPVQGLASLLGGCSHVLSSVPPDMEGDAVLDCHGDDLAAQTHLEWVGYLSTTGVYGNTDGAIVDETAPLNPNPKVKRAVRRAAADRAWQDLGREASLPVHIFRLSGIYGPGRNMLETVRAGKAKRVVKPGHLFSRIHVDDISAVLQASMQRPCPGAIYNLCDDDPAQPADVTAYACDLLGVAPPPPVSFEEAAQEMTPMALTFWADNRRVDNSKIKKDLGITLKYPTYKSGLQSLLETTDQG